MSEHYTDKFFFFFNDTATTEIYTLSLHDALPICRAHLGGRLLGDHPLPADHQHPRRAARRRRALPAAADRKSTRLNSSHANISYAVFCLKKKKNYIPTLHFIHIHSFVLIYPITIF